MGKAQTNEKHPKGFYACCITFMFERLAFYGAKPILLLFLITATLQGGLGIERTDAAVMAANLTAYTYMAPLIGGIISDNGWERDMRSLWDILSWQSDIW